MSNASSAKGNPASKRMTNPSYKAKRARNKARNERLRAIGVVSRDPYDHVSWSPVVSPRAYCLKCYNERLLAALDFIRREMVQ